MAEAAAPILLLILAAIGAYFGLCGMSRYLQRNERAAGKFVSGRISWLGTYAEAFQRSLDLLAEQDAMLISADAGRGSIAAGTAPAVLGFGCTVRIKLRTQEGVTFVEIEAASTLNPLSSLGPRSLVNRFLVRWEALPGPVQVV